MKRCTKVLVFLIFIAVHPGCQSRSRTYHDTASTIPLGITPERLEDCLGKPYCAQTWEQFWNAFQKKAIPRESNEYIRNHVILRDHRDFQTYADFALYSVFNSRLQQGDESRSEEDWQDQMRNLNCEVLIYAEQEEFGPLAFAPIAWIYFFAQDELICKSYVEPWLDEFFKPEN